MATYKQIQTAHEVRMWLKEVIIPAVGIGVVVASQPEVRQTVGDGFKKVKKSIKKKFKKEES